MINLGKHKYQSWLPAFICSFFVLLFLSLAVYKISLPGLQYDESLFIQPALGAKETIFIYKQLGGIPLMLMEYLGALKSWLYAPIFLLFGVSPLTIRLPMILLSAFTLVILFRMLRRESGLFSACILTLLMAVDPCFILHSRLDLGPFVIRMFIKAVVLDQWFLTVRSPSISRLAIIGVLIAIGIWDKLNFVWFAFAFGVAVLIVYPSTLLSAWKKSCRAWRVIALIFVAICLVSAFIFASHYYKNDVPLPSHKKLDDLVESTFDAFSGNAITTFMVNHPLHYPALNPIYKKDQVLKANPLLVGRISLLAVSRLDP